LADLNNAVNIQAGVGEAWDNALEMILEWGTESSPREMKTKEILGSQIIIADMRENILVNPIRGLNYKFMVAEWLWIMAGKDDVESIAKYNKQIAKFSDDGEIFNGAYGPRLAPQWEYVINSLRKPDSRQSVATIWTPSPTDSRDIPCTIAFQFLLRHDVLHMIATMRSSDAWLGLPYDIFNFSQIGNGLAGRMGVQPGCLTMQLGSLHLYENHWEQAYEVLDGQFSKTLRSPYIFNMPPAEAILAAADEVRDGNTLAGLTLPRPFYDYCEVLWQPTKAKAFEVLEKLCRDLP
jgi:thymidylate synthase